MSEKHIIDCDADPYLPPKDRWGREYQSTEHRRHGILEWGVTKVELYQTEWQKRAIRSLSFDIPHATILGNELRDKSIVNANALDYLLEHSYLLHELWAARNCEPERPEIYFWGTHYVHNDKHFLRSASLSAFGHWRCERMPLYGYGMEGVTLILK